MGEDPDRIRREIEATREEMGETVDALTYKADVKSRAKESLMGTKDSIKSKVVGASDRVSGATPDGEQVKDNARRAAGIAQENPLGLAIGSVAAGFIVGMLLPSSRVEDRKLGPIADDVKEKAKETGQEALERGQQVAQEAAQSAQQTVQEKGREHGEQLADSAQQNMQEATSSRAEHADPRLRIDGHGGRVTNLARLPWRRQRPRVRTSGYAVTGLACARSRRPPSSAVASSSRASSGARTGPVASPTSAQAVLTAAE